VRHSVVAAFGVIAFALAGCGGGSKTTIVRVTTSPAGREGFGPPSELVEYGHIDSLARARGRYELKFDPAWLLSGETASAAAGQDGAVEPGEPVPNDNYVVDESHRLYSYRVHDDARVTVLTRRGEPAQLGATPVSVSELARIVSGSSSMKLFEPLTTGVWITIDGDAVTEIDQQYRP
jgi:hypothetical protein